MIVPYGRRAVVNAEGVEVFTEVVEENFRCTEASQLPPHLTSPIHSASIWYHFAFVAISVALLGWGLGGFTVHLMKQRVRLSMETAALVTLLYAGAIPLCLWLLARFPFEMERLPLYFLAPLLPFFLAGMALSIVFDLQRAVAGSLYFADLVGAAVGAVLVTLLLHALGGEAALLTAAIGPGIAAVLLTGVRVKGVGGSDERL